MFYSEVLLYFGSDVNFISITTSWTHGGLEVYFFICRQEWSFFFLASDYLSLLSKCSYYGMDTGICNFFVIFFVIGNFILI